MGNIQKITFVAGQRNLALCPLTPGSMIFESLPDDEEFDLCIDYSEYEKPSEYYIHYGTSLPMLRDSKEMRTYAGYHTQIVGQLFYDNL